VMAALIPRMASALSTNAKQNGHNHSSDVVQSSPNHDARSTTKLLWGKAFMACTVELHPRYY
jgi:hypothetical protein